jgi:hypothetical protein
VLDGRPSRDPEMATGIPGGPRGRRKQAKPQRKGTGPFFDPPLVGGGVGGVIHHRAKHGKAAHVLFRFAFNLMRCIAK